MADIANKPDKEEKGAIPGILGEAGDQLKKKAAAGITKVVLAVLSIVSGAIANFYQGLPERARDIFWGVAGLALLLAVYLFIAGYIQYRKKQRAGAVGPPSGLVPAPAASVVLFVELSIQKLLHAYPDSSLRLGAVLGERAFAALSVKNIGTANGTEIVAECSVPRSSVVVPCHWSKESDGKFSLGGRHVEDLNVSQERVLLIAQVFRGEKFREKKFWAPLPSDQKNLFQEAGFRMGPFEQRIISPPGEPLEIDRNAELIVTLRAEGVDHPPERILLSFDSADSPTISRFPK